MQALLDHYLKRVTVNRSTLGALFKAADSDSDSLVDRPQYKAAVTVAKPDVTDTLLTTIWLEREKVSLSLFDFVSVSVSLSVCIAFFLDKTAVTVGRSDVTDTLLTIIWLEGKR